MKEKELSMTKEAYAQRGTRLGERTVMVMSGRDGGTQGNSSNSVYMGMPHHIPTKWMEAEPDDA